MIRKFNQKYKKIHFKCKKHDIVSIETDCCGEEYSRCVCLTSADDGVRKRRILSTCRDLSSDRSLFIKGDMNETGNN